ncbi:MAG TPA: heparin lyase I family protein [Alphaproteobacteria bacterium]|nr:heparin lyase I family protein [Alphaproteobacteria bacterium]
MSNKHAFMLLTATILAISGILIFTINSDYNIMTGNVVHNSYSGFGDPEARFSIDFKNITFNNDSDTVNVTITVSDFAIYNKGYVSLDGQDWSEFTLSAQGEVKNEWIFTSATAAISMNKDSLRLNTNRTNTSENYIIVYTCSRSAPRAAWDCHNGWQIIDFKAEYKKPQINSPSNSTNGTNNTNVTTNILNSTNTTSTTPIAGATFTTLWSGMDWITLNSDTYIRQYGGGQNNSLITIGSTDYLRSPGTQSVKYYHDGNANRVELHSRMNYLGVKEGTTVYMGWSDYYTILPIHNYTVFQWRDQDKRSNSSSGYTGCPIIGFDMVYRYSGHFNSSGGTTIKGIIVRIKEGRAPGGKGTIIENIQANQWYDYVVAIKYSKGSDGYFNVWAGPSGTLDHTDQPVYSYTGPTMYSLSDLNTSTAPCSYDGGMEDHFNSPQLRMGGAYQWGTKAVFESYKGPLRININETGEIAFAKVMPR